MSPKFLPSKSTAKLSFFNLNANLDLRLKNLNVLSFGDNVHRIGSVVGSLRDRDCGCFGIPGDSTVPR